MSSNKNDLITEGSESREMTNYRRILSQMTPEKMANANVKVVIVNNSQPFYITSSGQLFNFDDFDSAVKYEYDWLNTVIPYTNNEVINNE